MVATTIENIKDIGQYLNAEEQYRKRDRDDSLEMIAHKRTIETQKKIKANTSKKPSRFIEDKKDDKPQSVAEINSRRKTK